jgi:hypothetical protein
MILALRVAVNPPFLGMRESRADKSLAVHAVDMRRRMDARWCGASLKAWKFYKIISHAGNSWHFAYNKST